MLAAIFAVSAGLALWLTAKIVGAVPRSGGVLEAIGLVMAPMAIWVALMSGIRLMRGGDYLVVGPAGLAIHGAFGSEECHWTAVTRIAPSGQHGFGQIEVDVGPDRTYLVNAHWLGLKPAAATDLLTRYWRHARFGEAFEGGR